MISVKEKILNFMSYARGDIYIKSARIGLRDNYPYNNGCRFQGGLSQKALVFCLSPSLMYHGITVAVIENLAADRAQAI